LKKLIFIIIFMINLHSSTIYMGISANPSRLNPILATDSSSSEIAGHLFSSLFSYDKDGNIKNELAKGYKFIDKKTLLIELNDNIKWSDGVAITTDDIIFTYNIITSPKIFTPYSDEFRFVDRIIKIDNKNIKVIYKQPYFKALEIWMTSILPKHILKNEKDIMTSSFNKKPIGSGAYTLKNFEISKNLNLKANPNYIYHKPNIENIEYKFVADSTLLELKAGNLDIGSITPLQYERQLDKNLKDKFNIIEDISKSYTYIGFNFKKRKFQNPKVREAISLAIDRQEIIDLLFFGHAKICTGPFMPNTFAFNENVKSPKIDINRAKILLKEAGYTDANPLLFEIATSSSNQTRVFVAQIIQQQLSRVGIKVKLKAIEWQAFLSTVVDSRNFDTVLLGWGLGLTPDAYSIWHSKSDRVGGFNFIGYKNNNLDKLIEYSEQEIDKTKLSKAYKEMFKIITDDNPYIFLYIPNSITLVNKRIKNVSKSIIGITHNYIDWIAD